MTTKPKILVVGATGAVGRAVVPHLKANPNAEAIAGARNTEKAADLGLPADGTAVKPDEVFDNLPAIIGRQPKTLADFARKHADEFRY